MSRNYQIKDISSEDVKKIYALEENWALDIKGKNISPAKLSRTISALANHNGGEIFVGISHRDVKNNYFWDGFSNIEETNQFIDVIDSILPNFSDCSFEYYKCEDYPSVILHITIFKTLKVIKSTDNIAYLRTGAQNKPITTSDRLLQLERDKGISSYEDELTRLTYEEIKNSSASKSDDYEP